MRDGDVPSKVASILLTIFVAHGMYFQDKFNKVNFKNEYLM